MVFIVVVLVVLVVVLVVIVAAVGVVIKENNALQAVANWHEVDEPRIP